ncbi:hypothetical protein [Streptomyces oryzae]|uniref:hypothetical protein n=1 Tax=Streptomyces oryzae TaxID=1434886 RepID=UPI0027DEA89D|nr:hypothetical protein [Streptomyces oryzae]
MDDDGSGFVSRLADEMEEEQLKAGDEIVAHACELLSEPKVSVRELRFLVKCLCQALRDALRVAESRGRRLPARTDDEPQGRPGVGLKPGTGACQ